jgi:hypothetical protein
LSVAKASALDSRIYISSHVAQSHHIDPEKKHLPLARTGIESESA